MSELKLLVESLSIYKIPSAEFLADDTIRNLAFPITSNLISLCHAELDYMLFMLFCLFWYAYILNLSYDFKG